MKQTYTEVMDARKREKSFREIMFYFISKISRVNLKSYVKSYEIDKIDKEDAL